VSECKQPRNKERSLSNNLHLTGATPSLKPLTSAKRPPESDDAGVDWDGGVTFLAGFLGASLDADPLVPSAESDQTNDKLVTMGMGSIIKRCYTQWREFKKYHKARVRNNVPQGKNVSS